MILGSEKICLEDVKTMFNDTNIIITTEGKKLFRSCCWKWYIQSSVCRRPCQWLEHTVSTFINHSRKSIPGSLLSFCIGFRSKLNYFTRTIPEISHHLVPLKETLRNRFVTAITGGYVCNDTERKLLSLPTRFANLAITCPCL